MTGSPLSKCCASGRRKRILCMSRVDQLIAKHAPWASVDRQWALTSFETFMWFDDRPQYPLLFEIRLQFAGVIDPLIMRCLEIRTESSSSLAIHNSNTLRPSLLARCSDRLAGITGSRQRNRTSITGRGNRPADVNRPAGLALQNVDWLGCEDGLFSRLL